MATPPNTHASLSANGPAIDPPPLAPSAEDARCAPNTCATSGPQPRRGNTPAAKGTGAKANCSGAAAPRDPATNAPRDSPKTRRASNPRPTRVRRGGETHVARRV